MPFRRRSVKKKFRSNSSRAVRAACEALENRCLMTAVVNGRFTGTNSSFENLTYFEYRQGNGDTTIRISVTGNITAEFIGGTYDPTIGVVSHVTVGDLLPADRVATSDQFLFSIYVVQADMNSAISIAQVPNPNTTGTPRPMQPFAGGVTVRINDPLRLTDLTDATGPTVTTTGGVYIGALTPTALGGNLASIPLLFADRRAFGMRPSSAGELWAGLETAPGVSLGKFFVGGAITGIVDVAGNMDTFYAGNIWTGNAQGLTRYSSAPASTFELNLITTTPRNNFHFGGDIRNIIVGNSIGTTTLVGLTDLEQPLYKTGFDMQVGGRVGQLLTVQSFLGAATVSNSTHVSGPGSPQRELEKRSAPGTGDFSFFDPRFNGIDIGIGDISLTTNAIATRVNNNDSFGTAQFLGTARSAQLKNNSMIQLRGVLEQGSGLATNTLDWNDYYAIPLLGGQTIDVQLLDDYVGLRTTNHPRLGIFDPEGRLIASDYSNVGLDSRVNKPIRITASRPGAYRIAVGTWGDPNFNYTGAGQDVGETVAPNFLNLRYELRVKNVGDLAWGGLISTGPIATLDVNNTSLNVVRGDLGEIRAGTPAATVLTNPITGTNLTGNGIIYSEAQPYQISKGNFRVMEAVNTGATIFNATSFIPYTGSGPDFLVPSGTVGLLRSTGTGTTAAAPSVLVLNDSNNQIFSKDGVTVGPFPTNQDDLRLTSRHIAVGGDIQMIDCGGVLEGDYLANGNIGVIRAGEIGGSLSHNFDPAQAGPGAVLNFSAPVIQTNVDGVGNDGVIDLIDVTLNVNAPAISTGKGGNLRYMHVSGLAFVDTFFGPSGFPQDTLYSPGERVSITDDSGAQVLLTPLPLDPNTAFPLPQNRLSDFLDAPRLTVSTYPIRYSSGSAILRVIVTPQDDTTDGVVRQGGGGLMVESSGKGSVEITEVARGNPATLNANLPSLALPAGTSANTITFDPFNRIFSLTAIPAPVPPTAPRDVNFVFRGKNTVDVWNINDLLAGDTITSINNQTNGEIVNISSVTAAGAAGAVFPDILSIQAETLGLAKHHTGAAVEGTILTDNVFPFYNQRNMVRVADVDTIRVRRGLGNILANNGSIGSIIANSDHKDTGGVFEGINGPIVARGTTNLSANIVNMDIGEGIMPSGTGLMPLSGVYVDGIVDRITGSGDIRGNIVAGGQTPFATQQAIDPVTGAPLTNSDGTPLIVSTPTSMIGSIKLKSGSIVDANLLTNVIVTPSGVGLSAPSNEGYLQDFYQFNETVADSFDNPFFDIGEITLSGSGGIIGTSIIAADVGPIQVKGGFGVLSTSIKTFSTGVFDGIRTDGYGIRNDVFVGGSVNELDARGQGTQAPVTKYSKRVRFSEKRLKFDPYSGLSLDAFNDLDEYLGTTLRKPKVSGWTISGMIADSTFQGTRDLGKVNAQDIRASSPFFVNTRTGKKTRIPYGDALFPMAFRFGNTIGSIVVRDDVDGLTMQGGSVNKFAVGREVFHAFLAASGKMKSLSALTFRSSSTIDAGSIETLSVKRDLAAKISVDSDAGDINVARNLQSTSFHVNGDVDSLSIKGSILTGSSTVIEGTLSKLFIAHDIKAGASLEAGAIESQTINGQITGDIIIS